MKPIWSGQSKRTGTGSSGEEGLTLLSRRGVYPVDRSGDSTSLPVELLDTLLDSLEDALSRSAL
jgi:hypothetical protein